MLAKTVISEEIQLSVTSLAAYLVGNAGDKCFDVELRWTALLARCVGAFQTSTQRFTTTTVARVKPGFHYPSWRPELTGDRFPLPVNSGR